MDMGGEEEDQDQAKAKKHFDQLEEGFELSTYQTRKKFLPDFLVSLVSYGAVNRNFYF